jgi:hypothetical protein
MGGIRITVIHLIGVVLVDKGVLTTLVLCHLLSHFHARENLACRRDYRCINLMLYLTLRVAYLHRLIHLATRYWRFLV